MKELSNLNNRPKEFVHAAMFLLEDALSTLPQTKKGDELGVLKHSFAEGMYVRELAVEKGYLIVTKIHKHSHPVFILKGDCSILTEKGVVRIKAPYYMITPAGTKRVVYVHEDTIWVTVHATDKSDLKDIEEEVIAKTFDDVLPTYEEVLELTEVKDDNVITITKNTSS